MDEMKLGTDITGSDLKESSGTILELPESGVLPQASPLPDPSTDRPSFWAATWAAQTRYNAFVAAPRMDIARYGWNSHDPVKGFNPFDDLDMKYAPYSSLIAEAESPEALKDIKEYIDFKRQEKADANSSIPANLVGTFVGALATAAPLLPVGGLIPATTMLGLAARGAFIGAVTDVPIEMMLMKTDPEFHLDEAWTGVALSALGGAILEPIVAAPAAVAKAAQASAEGLSSGFIKTGPKIDPEMIKPVIQAAEDALQPSVRLTPSGSVTPEEYLKLNNEESLAPATGVFAPAFNFIKNYATKYQPSIAARLLTSPSTVVKQLVNNLVEHNFVLNKTDAGRAAGIAAESEIEANVIRRVGIIDDAIDEGYVQHVKAGGKLTKVEFEYQTSLASRRTTESDIPGVSYASKIYAKEMDQYQQEYVKYGLFKEVAPPKDGERYMTRAYDRDAIKANPQGFRDLLARKIEPEIRDDIMTEMGSYDRLEVGDNMARAKNVARQLNNEVMAQEIETKGNQIVNTGSEAEVKAWNEKLIKYLKANNDKAAFESEIEKKIATQVDRAVEQLRAKIMGATYFDMEHLSWSDKNLKARTLHISDLELEPFLRNDMRNIARSYITRAERDINIYKRFGTTNKSEILDKVNQDYMALREGITDKNRLAELDAQAKADTQDLEVLIDRLQGTRGRPNDPEALSSKAVRFLLPFNVARSLGGVTISMMPESGRGIVQKFISYTARRELENMGLAIQKVKLSQAETKSLGIRVDHARRLMDMLVGEPVAHDMIARDGVMITGAKMVSEGTIKYSGMEALDNFNRGMIAASGADEMHAYLVAAKANKINPKQKTFLATYGIDPSKADKFLKMIEKHGETVDGVLYMNVDQWEGEIGDVMRTAIRKYTLRHIVNPGAADRFAFADANGTTKLIMQFRSYMQGAWSRTLLPGMQRADSAFLATLITAVGMGYLGTLLYAKLTGTEKRIQDMSASQLLLESVGRSGAVPYLFDLYSTGSNAFFGGGTQRQQIQGRLDTLLGPTAGLVSRGVPATGRLLTGELAPSDIKTLKGLVPLNNLIWWNWYLNEKAKEEADRIRQEKQQARIRGDN